MNIEYITASDPYSGYVKAGKAYMKFLRSMGHVVQTSFQHHIPDCRFLHVAAYGHPLELLDLDVPTAYLYAWEYPDLPPLFKLYASNFKRVVTFSQLQVDVYKQATGKNNIDLLPNPPLIEPTEFKKRMADQFTFLAVNRWDCRKDFEILARAFADEFKPSEPVRMLLKISHGNINDVMKRIGEYLGRSNMNVIMYNYSEPEMNELYRSADVYVSTTHCEGWGYGFQDALLNGVPCIYPKSPYIVRTFFNESNSIGVSCATVPVKHWDVAPYFDGMNSVWSQTDYEDLRSKLRHAYEYYPFRLPVRPAKPYYDDQETLIPTLNRIVTELTNG